MPLPADPVRIRAVEGLRVHVEVGRYVDGTWTPVLVYSYAPAVGTAPDVHELIDKSVEAAHRWIDKDLARHS